MKKIAKISGFIFIFLLLSGVGIHYFNLLKNSALTHKNLAKFTYIPYTNDYTESQPRFYVSEKPFKEAILILHGYSGSPEEFKNLYPTLNKIKMPYYAPQITGFGLGDMHLLTVVTSSDWVRDAINAYDILANLADKVNVIAHSNGGSIAVILAAHRPINRLILVAPNIAVSQQDKRNKFLLQTPVIGTIGSYLLPVTHKPYRPNRVTVSDTLDTKAALAAFQYPALPIESVVALWQLQDQAAAGLSAMRAKQIFVLYGKFDETVNMQQVISDLDRNKIKYKTLEYAHAAHNVLDDYDHPKAINDIITILQGSRAPS